jgi:hypothetical protein
MVKIGTNRNSHSLLWEIQNNAVTWKKVCQSLTRLKHILNIRTNNCAPRYLPNLLKCMSTKKETTTYECL